MAHLVPRPQYMVATATFLELWLSHLHPRIWLTILERNRMMMLRYSTHIKSVSGQQNMLPYVWKKTSHEDYQTAHIPWNHPKTWSWSLCRLLAMYCFWWACSLAIYTQSHCGSSWCGLFGQWEWYKQPPSCPLVVVRIKCTGWMVIQGFVLCVGIFLALWRVDGWVIIWSFLERFWVSFWYVIYCIITSIIFMHEGLCWKFTMLWVMVETLVLEKGIVVAIGLCVWLSCNWEFGIFAQQTLARMIFGMRTQSSSLR